MPATVSRVNDFDLTGDGTNPAWHQIPWFNLPPIKGPARYTTRVKIVYSAAGFYCLFDCQDRRISCTGLNDNDELYTQDVVELFLWPDEKHPVYFEYELSPRGKELPLLVSNTAGTFMGWSPWQYTADRRVKKAVDIRTDFWSAEIFVPFALLKGLSNCPPTPGTIWRANFYRIDYDESPPTWFAWATGVQNTFHDLNRFGSILFSE